MISLLLAHVTPEIHVHPEAVLAALAAVGIVLFPYVWRAIRKKA